MDTNISFRSCFGHRLCSRIVIFTVWKIPHTISKTIVCFKSRALGHRRYSVSITTEICCFWFCFLITHVSDAKLYLSPESPIHRFASAIHMSSLEKCILCFFTCFCCFFLLFGILRALCLSFLRNHFLSLYWCVLLIYSTHFSQIFQTVMPNSGPVIASFPRTTHLI